MACRASSSHVALAGTGRRRLGGAAGPSERSSARHPREHVVDRRARGELAPVEGHPAGGVEADGGDEGPSRSPTATKRRAVLRALGDPHPRRAGGEADGLDLHVVLVGPEVRRRGERAAARPGAATRLRPAAVPCSAATVQCSMRTVSPSASGCGQAAMSPAQKTSSAPAAASVASHTTPGCSSQARSPAASPCWGSRRARRARRRPATSVSSLRCSASTRPAPSQRLHARRRAAGRRRGRGAARAQRSPSCGPSDGMGCAASSISVTSRPSLRAVAATSQPMKPAPMMATRGPPANARAQRERVVDVAQEEDALERRLARVGPRPRAGRPWRAGGWSRATSSPSREPDAPAVGIQARGGACRAAT